MTALTDQCNVIRGWLAIGSDVYPDSVVTSWIRMSEESLSKRLRCKDMMQIDVGRLVNQRYLLPSDWRHMDFVRVVGGKPLRYEPKDTFYDPNSVSDQQNCYTLSGNYIIVGVASADGPSVEIHYYQDIAPLGDNPSWMITKYPTLFTIDTLHKASMYAIEDERGPTWSTESDRMVDEINSEHQLSKASGSLLSSRKRRSFG